MPSIPLAPLPEYLTTVQTWSLDDVSQLSRLRAELAEALASSDEQSRSDREQLTQGLILVCSELATNALNHGHPPTVVRLLKNGSYILDIMDHDPDQIPAIATGRGLGEGGYGLVLTDMIASQVGWYSAERTKHIWASFPILDRQRAEA